MQKLKSLNIETIINILLIFYFFFLSRRGGDSKDRVALMLMLCVFIYSIKLKCYTKYLIYKKEIIIGSIYIILVSISYFFSPVKYGNRFYTYTHATIFSLGFFFITLNYYLKQNLLKYILPILIFISFPAIYNGLKDTYLHYNILENYRIAGYTYTTIYALELGIYFLIGIFSLIYYKNKYLKILFLLYLSIIMVLILATQSRNTFLMLPLTLIFVSFLKDYKKGIAILILTFLIGLLIIKSPLKIKSIDRIHNSITSTEKIKKDARYIIFKEGIEISKKNLFKGDGFFRYGDEEKRKNEIEYYEHFHNIFIETAVTQGLLALISYVIFLLTLFYRLVKNYFVENDKLKKNIKLMTVAVFVFSHLYGLAEPIFYFEKLYQLIFTIITISVIIDNPEMDEERKEKNDINIRS